MEINLNSFVEGYIKREIKKLYTSYLYTIEDLHHDGIITEETFAKMRKRVLDGGNDCIRNIQEQLECLDFKINSN